MRIPLALALAIWFTRISALPVAQQPATSEPTQQSPNFIVRNAGVIGPVAAGLTIGVLGFVGLKKQAQATARSIDRHEQGTIWQETLEGGYQRWRTQKEEGGTQGQARTKVQKSEDQEIMATTEDDAKEEQERARRRQDELREARRTQQPQLWVDLPNLQACINHMVSS